MLDTMSSEEYVYWQAYFKVEPFPEERADIRTAEMIQAIAQLGGSKVKIEELLPDWWNERGRRTPDSPALMQSKMRMVAATVKQKQARKNELRDTDSTSAS